MKTPGLAILISACALLLAQPALAATTHYVSPTGSGADCTQALPCALAGAVTGLTTGDTIVVGPGVYDLGGGGSFAVPTGVALVGAPGPRPTITSNSIASTVQASQATVSHLSILQTGTGLALGSFGSTLDDLTITSSGSGVSVSTGDVLRDSVVKLIGVGGSGIQATGMGALDVRNVLVSAPDSAFGIQAVGNCFPMFIDPMQPPMCLPIAQPTVNVRNSIVRAGTDLATSGMSGFNGIINVAYSDYRAAKTSAAPAGTVVDGGGNIESEPLFADAAGGDFHPVTGSPTIDAGDPAAGADPKIGPLALDGLTRIMGGRIDMGPFEFVPAQSGTTDTNGGGGAGGSQQQGGGGDAGSPAVEKTPAAAVADRTPPVLKSLRLAPGLLRKSSLVSYLLNEQATTTLRVLRKTTGVKKGRTCVAAPRKLKKGAKRCTRWVVISGAVTRVDQPGKNSFRFNGKLRGKRLASGSYRLVAVAQDAAGNVGKPITVAFRVR